MPVGNALWVFLSCPKRYEQEILDQCSVAIAQIDPSRGERSRTWPSYGEASLVPTLLQPAVASDSPYATAFWFMPGYVTIADQIQVESHSYLLLQGGWRSGRESDPHESLSALITVFKTDKRAYAPLRGFIWPLGLLSYFALFTRRHSVHRP